MAAVLLVACTVPPPPAVTPESPQVVALSREIRALGPTVDGGEASRAARTLLRRTRELVGEYRLVRPAHAHNVLVNLGLRERGLCCHFAEDLIAGLRALELTSLDVHWVVARHGSRLREHSSVLLAPSGAPIGRGLVFDAWRHSGELLWTRIDDDRYPWELHPLSGRWEALHCTDS